MASILADMAWTAGVGRSHFAHRAGVPFKDVQSLQDGLRALANLDTDEDATPPQAATRVAFLYTGEGSQWVGMGRELYDTEPTARAVLDFCDSVVQQERGVSLLDVMFGREGAKGNLDDPSWAQPALYSLQCALTALWSDVGIRPFAVLGDGPGELSAAQAAGVFSLEDGLRFVLARGELMANGDDLDALQATLAGVQLSPPAVALVSGLAGGVIAPYAPKDVVYWTRQATEAAPLEERVSVLADLEVDTVIEIGPDSVLDRDVILHHLDSPILLSSLSSQADSQAGMRSIGFAEAVAEAYRVGFRISFEGLFTGEARRRISLPTYPFQRRRHWV